MLTISLLTYSCIRSVVRLWLSSDVEARPLVIYMAGPSSLVFTEALTIGLLRLGVFFRGFRTVDWVNQPFGLHEVADCSLQLCASALR